MLDSEARDVATQRSRRLSRFGDLLTSPAIQLAGYYLVLGAIGAALAWWSPDFRRFLLPDGSAGAVTNFPESLDAGPPPASSASLTGTFADVLLALLGALACSAPLVWIYTVIMRQEGYEKSFIRMLIILPIVVAGVVQVVRGDLALAFALAGIVAAVRFRTTVKDLQNAVFAFAAIGIGLAAGTVTLLLSLALSLVVTYLAYTLWRLNIGDVQPSLELGHAGVSLSEALVPGEPHRPVILGDEEAVEPVHAEDLDPLSGSIDRLADYVRADALRKKKKYNTLLLAYTDQSEAASENIESILDECARRWVHVDTISRNGGDEPPLEALEYLVRLKKEVDVGRMVDRLDCGEGRLIRAVELKPIKGLRKRLTS